MKILLIEDNKNTAETLKRFLENKKWKIIVSQTGEDALKKFKKYKNNIDIIILDLLLPGIDGFQVLKKIRKQINNPIIVLSNLSSDKDRHLSLDLGADEYLIKGRTSLKKLIETIDKTKKS